jgi:phenylacetate-CoA ligase
MRALLKMALGLLPGQTSDIARIAYDCLPPGLRYGRAYRQTIALLERSERWTLPELQAHQRRRLDPLLLHCLENVPYYTRAFGELGVDAAAIKSGLDISALPLLTKDDVRRNKAELRARNIPFRRCEPANTGGSTGDPLDFTLDLDARAMERALTLRQLRWLGYEKGDVIAEIKADAFADPARLFRYFPCSKQVRFSFLSADDAKLAATVAALERFRPAFIKAYPSALALLAGWLGRHKRRIPPPPPEESSAINSRSA